VLFNPWHEQHLNEVEPFANDAINPSAERVAEQIALAVMKQLPQGVTLVEACVGEAEGCTAVYRP